MSSCTQSLVGALGLVALLGCSGASDAAAPDLPEEETRVEAGTRADGGPAHDAGTRTDRDRTTVRADAAQALSSCAALGGVAPRTIREAVERLNALPAPASLACFVASLPRPLSLVASSSPSSAQPSGGRDNPRIFIVSDTLTMSVVPDGTGRDLLEFGEWTTPLRSTKAELAFPLTRPVSHEAPYQDRGDEQSVSLCGLCHTGQEAHPSIPGALVSLALRPARYYEMTIADVRAVRDACEAPPSDTPRCQMLRALFDYGEVRQGKFDDEVVQGF
jgi:hypothetical protein